VTALRPDWAKGFSRRGMALLKLGRAAEAAAACERGLALEPGNRQLRELSEHISASVVI
jgi:stress-induced-phosphoprotein 1